jgi:hypothetical protein
MGICILTTLSSGPTLSLLSDETYPMPTVEMDETLDEVTIIQRLYPARDLSSHCEDC